MTAAKDAEIEAQYDATRTFATFLPKVDSGSLAIEATEELTALLAFLESHADETRRDAKGSITVKLNFVVDEKGHAGVTGDVVVKKPRPRRGGSHFWLLKGKLSERDPRQQELPLQDVSKKTKIADPGAKPAKEA